MKRYNVLLADAGLYVVKTKAYLRKLRAEPGFKHGNWGDFYTEYPHRVLASIIFTSMAEEGLAKKVRVVTDQHTKFRKDSDYVIKGNDSIRVYSPATHLSTEEFAVEVYYNYVCSLFAEQLFCEVPVGSFQREVIEEIKPLKKKRRKT